MNADIENSALLKFLLKRNPVYFGKAIETRKTIEGWLSYIPQTFPHYTRHTIHHSDEIIRQVSKILFLDDNPDDPVIQELSSIEAYILVSAAFLHDAGMVVSDQEKLSILGSEEWRTWVTEEGGAQRWQQIETFRAENPTIDPTVRNFIADIQTRHLISEFIRRVHHYRAADVISQHQHSLGDCALGDPILAKTISDVCIAHGLRPRELEDSEKYPHRRDIRDEKVNVRLMAILLRLGDLLDVTSERACPLLLNAACPLPPESFAHWTQYQRIVHRLTSHDSIEIRAECETQEEHRFLQDWFQWLVAELEGAKSAMADAKRHANWRPPAATLNGPSATIAIKPASNATYFPANWTFEIDSDEVVQRLIYETYGDQLAFIRELIQNAADATRCQAYADFDSSGSRAPENPTKLPKDLRNRYPITVQIVTREIRNSLSGENEQRQAVVVEDCGLGMDEDVIKKYFLQIGRSYYSNTEFRRTFPFSPTSRFGVGFLSVFAVSDRVIVDTFKPTAKDSHPIKLTLTGPRSYLLTERGQRRRAGTRIEVLLRERFDIEQLEKRISGWCRRLEFPVLFKCEGQGPRTIEAEAPEQFLTQTSDISDATRTFAIRAFPFEDGNVQGELYIFSILTPSGEDWSQWQWADSTYRNQHPQATIPGLPDNLTCFHGISLGSPQGRSYRGTAVRWDYRGKAWSPSLSRSRNFHRLGREYGLDQYSQAVLENHSDNVLRDHLLTTGLAKADNSWKYKQRLVPVLGSVGFWQSADGTVPIQETTRKHLVSLNEALTNERITVICDRLPLNSIHFISEDDQKKLEKRMTDKVAFQESGTAIFESDLQSLSTQHREQLFLKRDLVSVRIGNTGLLCCDWHVGVQNRFSHDGADPLWFLPLPSEEVVGIRIHVAGERYVWNSVINSKHPFGIWLSAMKTACGEGNYGLTLDNFTRLTSLLRAPLNHRGHEVEILNRYLCGFADIAALPPELKQLWELRADMFELSHVRQWINDNVSLKGVASIQLWDKSNSIARVTDQKQ